MKAGKSLVKLSVLLFIWPLTASAERPFDPMSRDYMDEVETIADCAGTISAATGDTSFAEQYGLIDAFPQIAQEMVGKGLAYELEFELGAEFNEESLSKDKEALIEILEQMKLFESQASIIDQHLELIASRRAEKYMMSIGFNIGAGYTWTADAIRNCRRLIADRLAEGSLITSTE